MMIATRIPPSPGRLDALGDSFAVNGTNDHFFDDVKNDENNRKQDRPHEHWIHQRPSPTPLAKSKVVGHQHDLRQHKSVHETDAELRKRNLVLRQDDVLMNLKQQEHRPQIGEHRRRNSANSWSALAFRFGFASVMPLFLVLLGVGSAQ